MLTYDVGLLCSTVPIDLFIPLIYFLLNIYLLTCKTFLLCNRQVPGPPSATSPASTSLLSNQRLEASNHETLDTMETVNIVIIVLLTNRIIIVIS